MVGRNIDAIAKSDLLSLIRRQAILRGNFVLSSGRESEYYIDARQVTLAGTGARLIGQVVLEALRLELPDAVAGMTLGADPIVTAVTVTAAEQGLVMDGLLIRKEAKTHGTGKQIEGPLRHGMTAVVVEDTSTTGASALAAVDALKRANVAVQKVITLIDREEGAGDAIRQAGLQFEAVFSLSDVLKSA